MRIVLLLVRAKSFVDRYTLTRPQRLKQGRGLVEAARKELEREGASTVT